MPDSLAAEPADPYLWLEAIRSEAALAWAAERTAETESTYAAARSRLWRDGLHTEKDRNVADTGRIDPQTALRCRSDRLLLYLRRTFSPLQPPAGAQMQARKMAGRGRRPSDAGRRAGVGPVRAGVCQGARPAALAGSG